MVKKLLALTLIVFLVSGVTAVALDLDAGITYGPPDPQFRVDVGGFTFETDATSSTIRTFTLGYKVQPEGWNFYGGPMVTFEDDPVTGFSLLNDNFAEATSLLLGGELTNNVFTVRGSFSMALSDFDLLSAAQTHFTPRVSFQIDLLEAFGIGEVETKGG